MVRPTGQPLGELACRPYNLVGKQRHRGKLLPNCGRLVALHGAPFINRRISLADDGIGLSAGSIMPYSDSVHRKVEPATLVSFSLTVPWERSGKEGGR